MHAKATRFMRQPFFVMGYEVTDENMTFITQWCEGQLIENGHRRFIRVPVANARTPKQTEASVGNWVLRSRYAGRFTYKVYTKDWLAKEFIQVPDDEDDEPVLSGALAPSNVHQLPVQPAVHFVSAAERI